MRYPGYTGHSRLPVVPNTALQPQSSRYGNERLPASLALAVLAAERGAAIIRTHDVRETCDALAMSAALANLESQ